MSITRYIVEHQFMSNGSVITAEHGVTYKSIKMAAERHLEYMNDWHNDKTDDRYCVGFRIIPLREVGMTIIDEFLKLGRDASYHFADDTGAEWSRGNSFKKQAMDLYDANPDLQDEMLDKADFLWSLEGELDSRYHRQLQEIAACMSCAIKWRGAWGRAVIDARKAYPDVDPLIIEAMGVAITVYRERNDEK